MPEKLPLQAHPCAPRGICAWLARAIDRGEHIAPRVDALLVVGSPNSGHGRRWKDVAQRAGCSRARLALRAGRIDWALSSGIAAGGLAPRLRVEHIIEVGAARIKVRAEPEPGTGKTLSLPLPRQMRIAGAE